MIDQPLVSIVIPTYNRELYIEDCVNSALNQTYKNIEVIITDNCSSDKSWAILERIAFSDKRLKIYKNESNIGPVKNWERAVKYATGKYTKILWSDDLMDDSFLEHTIPYLESNPNVGFVYTKAGVFDNNESGINSKNILFDRGIESGVYNSDEFIKGIFSTTTFTGKYPYSPACAVFKTPALKKNIIVNIENDFNIDFSREAIGNDVLMFLLTAIDFPKFAFHNKVLVYFREHTGSISTQSSNKLDLVYHVAKSWFFNNYLNKFTRQEIYRYNTILKQMLVKNKGNQYGIHDLSQFHSAKKSGYNKLEILKEKLKFFIKKYN